LPRRLFGTDGVRGIAGEDLSHDLVEKLGRAFALWAQEGSVFVGRDTRASGAELEESLARGLISGGMEVRRGGVLPTPAVALLAGSGCAAVVSASHNPPQYNGIKFFAPEGRKLTDDEEREIEALLEQPAKDGGAVVDSPGARDRYVELLCDRFGTALDGLRLVVDCANGAMFEVAPQVFDRLDAYVVIIGNEPDGTNINSGCGATDLALLQETVRRGDFDLGVAFDGDGDRMLAVDSAGKALDGDQILAVLALRLGVELVAVTEMTNMGFHRLMAEREIRVVTTPVGDRYVLEALRREGGVLGGEQSGHLIYLDGHTTGDGLVAALLLCRAVVESGQPLGALAAVMPRYPQAKRDVPVRSKELSDGLRDRIDSLKPEGARVVVRPSGTEPVVRVLAEAESEAAAADLCATIAALVSRELGS
jgi:phosphoglucosamine mutase